MFGSGRPSPSALAALCHTMRHYLHAGLTVPDVFRREATTGRAALRPLAGRVSERLDDGADLGDALQAEGDALPPLFVALVRVGEQSGMLPEIFGDLEKHYTRTVKLRRDFLARVSWPVIQFVLAVLVIAGLIWILGEIGKRPGAVPYDPLGLGLSGVSGAAIFLGVVGGTLAGLAALWLVLTRLLRQRAAVDAFLLKVPLLGPCLRALALGRFCLALRLTTEAGMPIRAALRLSLAASGNAAFVSAGDRVDAAVRGGRDLTSSLARTGLLPDDFVHMLDVAEESGRLEEVLRHQSDHYDEEASRRLAALTAAVAYGVWLLLGACIIVAIFRLYSSYLNLLNSF